MKELKKYLIINCIFSAFSGFIMMVFWSSFNNFFAIDNAYIFPGIGANLLVFSTFVLFVLTKQLANKVLVNIISILDLLWFVGSFAIVGFGLFDISTSGNILISIVAIWIAFLAYKQLKYNN